MYLPKLQHVFLFSEYISRMKFQVFYWSASIPREKLSLGMPSWRSTIHQRNGLTLGFLSATSNKLASMWKCVKSVPVRCNDCFFYQHSLSRFDLTWEQSFSANVVRMQLGRNDFEMANVNRIRSQSVNVSGERERLKHSLDKRNFEDIEKHLLDTGPGSFDVSSFFFDGFSDLNITVCCFVSDFQKRLQDVGIAT